VPLDFHGMPQANFKLAGRVRGDGGQDRVLTYNVTPNYFRVLGLPLVAGHDFTALTDGNQPPQVIVNEEFVRRFVTGGSVLGQKIEGKSSFEIVGVVKNSLYETFGEPAKPIMYFSYRDRFGLTGQLHVRTTGPESALAPNLRRLVREINPAIALYDVRTLTEHVDKNLFFRKIPARLFTVLGPLILLLAAVGIYGVVAYAVAQRTREIGVRLALGASSGQVVRQIMRETLRVVCWGAGPAWLLTVVVMLHLRGGVLNASLLLGVPALLLGVAVVASWLPARRAARVDPLIALRTD
jgi:ABC-type antimicrobial peptide transport system permease subunit